MKIFLNNKPHPRLGIMVLLALLGGGGLHAQSITTYVDSMSVGNDPTVKMYVYGNMEVAPTAQMNIQDGAKIIFYGRNMKANTGAQFYGLDAQGANPIEGIGSGIIAFTAPNPTAVYLGVPLAMQQVLEGGNSGSDIHNTLVAMEIDNSDGVKLTGSHTRIGSALTFTQGHVYTDVQNMVMAQNATIAGANENKFVVTDNGGFLAMEDAGASNNSFPVGSSDVATDYLPAVLNNAGTADRYDVRAIGSLTPTPGSGATSMLTRSWQIKEAVAGGSNVTLALQHDIGTTEGTSFARSTAAVLTSPATAAWKLASASAITAAAVGAGSFVNGMSGITDFTTNTYFTKGLVAKTTPDLYAWFTSGGSSFQMSGSSIVDNRNMVVNVGELNGFATSGTVEIRVTKNANFDLTFDPTATSVNTGIPRAVNNADWTMTTTPAYYSFKTTRAIAANGTSKLGINLKVKSVVTSTVNTTVAGTIVTGSGGELSSDNVNNTVSILVSILF